MGRIQNTMAIPIYRVLPYPVIIIVLVQCTYMYTCITHVHVYINILGLRMRIMPRAKECQSGSSTHRLRSISDSSLLAWHRTLPNLHASFFHAHDGIFVGERTGIIHAHYVRARMRAKVLIDIPEARSSPN